MGKVAERCSVPAVHCAHAEMWPIHKLVPHPKNPNRHPPEQIERLAKIIDYQGWRHPIIVSKRSGFIVAGHARLLAAAKLKLEQVPVDVQDFESEAQEWAHLVADNAIAEFWSETDLAQVNMELPEFGPDFDIELLGIKDFTLEPSEHFDASPLKEGAKELSESDFQEFAHQCPKCGFQYNELGD